VTEGTFRIRPRAREQLAEAVAYGFLNYGGSLESGSKRRAPVRGGHRSFAPDGPVGGTLRRSVHAVVYLDGRRIGQSGNEAGDALPDYVPRMGIVLFVGTNSGYGFWVHEGTKKMPARPFLTEEFLGTRGQAPQLIRAGTRRRLGQ
jgi:hypothetical protein